MRRLYFPIALALAGCGVLIWLGFWQLDRLDWKQGILDDIDARLAADPVPLPASPLESDEYSTVTLSGQATGDELHVLVSGTSAGQGYRVLSAFATNDGRRIMVDQGLLDFTAKDAAPQRQPTDMTGTLIWPDDRNSSTPDPDIEANIWFARDVDQMAQVLNTEPVMVVLRSATTPDPRLIPLPVDSATIKNDHLNYAITWFLLAAVWAIMSVFLISRVLRTKV